MSYFFYLHRFEFITSIFWFFRPYILHAFCLLNFIKEHSTTPKNISSVPGLNPTAKKVLSLNTRKKEEDSLSDISTILILYHGSSSRQLMCTIILENNCNFLENPVTSSPHINTPTVICTCFYGKKQGIERIYNYITVFLVYDHSHTISTIFYKFNLFWLVLIS